MSWLWGKGTKRPTPQPAPVRSGKNEKWVPLLAKTSGGHKFLRGGFREGCRACTDNTFTYRNVPEVMLGGTHLITNYIIPPGVTITFFPQRRAHFYLIIESGRDGGRDGGLESRLREDGWRVSEPGASIALSGSNRHQVIISRPIEKGTVKLPPTDRDLCFSAVAVAWHNSDDDFEIIDRKGLKSIKLRRTTSGPKLQAPSVPSPRRRTISREEPSAIYPVLQFAEVRMTFAQSSSGGGDAGADVAIERLGLDAPPALAGYDFEFEVSALSAIEARLSRKRALERKAQENARHARDAMEAENEHLDRDEDYSQVQVVEPMVVAPTPALSFRGPPGGAIPVSARVVQPMEISRGSPTPEAKARSAEPAAHAKPVEEYMMVECPKCSVRNPITAEQCRVCQNVF